MRALADHGWSGPDGFASVRDYLNGPSDPPPGPERDAAMAALRAADREAERARDEAFAAALEQAGVQVINR